MILHIDILETKKNEQTKHLETTNLYHKLEDYKVNAWKPVVFLYINNIEDKSKEQFHL